MHLKVFLKLKKTKKLSLLGKYIKKKKKKKPQKNCWTGEMPLITFSSKRLWDDDEWIGLYLSLWSSVFYLINHSDRPTPTSNSLIVVSQSHCQANFALLSRNLARQFYGNVTPPYQWRLMDKKKYFKCALAVW